MKSVSTLFMAVFLTTLLPVNARAADPTITFDTGQPSSPAAGKVNGTGGYTFDPAAYTLTAVVMYASMAGGGQGGQVQCMTDPPTRTWSGTIAGLPGGTYNVFTRMRLVDLTTGLNVNFDSATKSVTVAAP